MKSLRAPTQEQAGVLIAMTAVLFGGWVRLLIPSMAGFPVNDGGLFYVMLRAVQANGLRIPSYVQYNGLNIPFAYPPLGFYVGAIAANVFRVDPIQVLQWLPAIVLIATLPALYFLAKVVLGTSFRAGMATLMYAFTPRAITWQIMGGGLTRSFGQLFLLLALAFIYLTFTGYSRKRLMLAIVFSSLVVLSHPEAALQAVGIAILFWLLRGRSKQSAAHAVEIGAGTLLLTAVWWLPAVLSFGAGTLLSAGQTGLHSAYALLQPLVLNFVDEPLVSLVSVFGIVGFAFEASRRRVLVPAWFIAPFIIEPRSAPTMAMIPLAMLAGLALTEVILPALAGLQSQSAGQPDTSLLRCAPVMVFLVFIGLYMLGSTSLYGSQLAGTTLSPGTRQAFAWVKANTPPNSRFLVLTGTEELFCNATQEWFPALTDRISPFTIQGKEWLPRGAFQETSAESQAYQVCVRAEDPLSCVQGVRSSSAPSMDFDYVFVTSSRPILQACKTIEISQDGQRLIAELQDSPQYSPIYMSSQVAVFERR